MIKVNVDKLIQSFPTQNTEVTDPGIRIDQFIPPPKQKSAGWFTSPFDKRRDLKTAAELIEKIERIPGTPEEMARYYFDADLQKLVALGQRYPDEIKTMVEQAKGKSSNRKATEPWYILVQAACGETRPLFQTFEKMDLKSRLALFRVILFSPHVGDGQLTGELFVKLMASTSHAEREKWVEPTLHSILNRGAWVANPKVKNKLAWLAATYHGWQKEAEELG